MISIIIPTLNEEKLLARMLQQFRPELIKKYDIELVVSDGGSMDSTIAIAKQHTRTVVENTAGTKQTISLGRNIGAQHARGEIFVFFNADTLVKDIDRFF